MKALMRFCCICTEDRPDVDLMCGGPTRRGRAAQSPSRGGHFVELRVKSCAFLKLPADFKLVWTNLKFPSVDTENLVQWKSFRRKANQALYFSRNARHFAWRAMWPPLARKRVRAVGACLVDRRKLAAATGRRLRA